MVKNTLIDPLNIGEKTKKMDTYMNNDIGKLVLDRLQASNKQTDTKSLLTENQRNLIIGERKDEQRSGKG